MKGNFQIIRRSKIHEFNGSSMDVLVVKDNHCATNVCLMEKDRLLYLHRIDVTMLPMDVNLEDHCLKEGDLMAVEFLLRMKKENQFMNQLGFEISGYDKYSFGKINVVSNFMSYYYKDMKFRSWSMINGLNGNCANVMFDSTIEDELLQGPFGVIVKYSQKHFMDLPDQTRDFILKYGY